MSPFRGPKQRLPEHLRHLRREPSARPASDDGADRRPPPEAPGTPDRLGELLPGVLRAMVGEGTRQRGPGPVVVGQAELLAALAPYHRPRSRFEGLMVRRLVGEGYLRPRGARDKHGFSAAYELTPKGERLLGWRRGG